ncbi:SDR family oxidoreductase [Pseudenhygromyxa sp. WMMC2535]|uniref:SDR family oxidoreductase n=1 Tax=Pseudenhygromyxa sp. WMMC2535 TaxID=2712867 RepID=UPI0015561E49|nr:SDR family oxidoreductase [Pseudenhygromyxa sp. WMMC2535]NVB41820.1 SDR family oxidoreductase [Pseudenhygromyxa sp. WMMC2535]
MTIAIAGSTGQLGRIVVSKLVEKIGPDDVIALARTPEKASDLGVTVREADYDRPDTLPTALAGVDTLLLISANDFAKRAQQHRDVIAAAKQAGVGRIVYTSLLRADSSPMSLAVDHRATEEALRESGVSITVLRNGWYIENHTMSMAAILEHGAVFGSAKQGRFSAATREDFAEAAVAVLTGEGHAGKTYELSGDQAYTLTDFAAEVARQTGKDIHYVDLSAEDYTAALEKAGLPAGVAGSLASWDVDAAGGSLYDGGTALSQLIGRPTTPLSEAVKASLG